MVEQESSLLSESRSDSLSETCHSELTSSNHDTSSGGGHSEHAFTYIFDENGQIKTILSKYEPRKLDLKWLYGLDRCCQWPGCSVNTVTYENVESFIQDHLEVYHPFGQRLRDEAKSQLILVANLELRILAEKSFFCEMINVYRDLSSIGSEFEEWESDDEDDHINAFDIHRSIDEFLSSKHLEKKDPRSNNRKLLNTILMPFLSKPAKKLKLEFIFQNNKCAWPKCRYSNVVYKSVEDYALNHLTTRHHFENERTKRDLHEQLELITRLELMCCKEKFIAKDMMSYLNKHFHAFMVQVVACQPFIDYESVVRKHSKKNLEKRKQDEEDENQIEEVPIDFNSEDDQILNKPLRDVTNTRKVSTTSEPKLKRLKV